MGTISTILRSFTSHFCKIWQLLSSDSLRQWPWSMQTNESRKASQIFQVELNNQISQVSAIFPFPNLWNWDIGACDWIQSTSSDQFLFLQWFSCNFTLYILVLRYWKVMESRTLQLCCGISVLMLLGFQSVSWGIILSCSEPFALCSIHLCSCRALSLRVLGMKKWLEDEPVWAFGFAALGSNLVTARTPLDYS